MTALHFIVLLAAGAAAQDPDQRDWQLLDGVAAIYNDEIITWGELDPMMRQARQRESITTAADFRRVRDQVVVQAITAGLAAQAGEDMSPDETQLQAQVEDYLWRERQRLGSLGFSEFVQERGADDVAELQLDTRRRIYREIWQSSVLGRSLGPNQRARVDRYVRPGQLGLYYERLRDFLGVPDRVVLQELTVYSAAAGGRKEARELAVELRQKLLAGEGFEKLVEEYGSTSRDSGGIRPVEPVTRLTNPDLRTFAGSAVVGEVSPVLPLDEGDGKDGYGVYKLLEREEGLPAPPIGDPDVQQRVRSEVLRMLDLTRLSRAELELRRQAYLWAQ